MGRIWNNMRIHNKLMVSFLAVCLVPLILVSSLLYVSPRAAWMLPPWNLLRCSIPRLAAA